MRLSMLSLGLFACALSACTLKATLDTTSDGVTNFLSSTSGRSWFTEDGLVRPEHKITAFTFYNFDNLQQDMARGGGEYLTSFASLVGVSEPERAAFQARAQQQFTVLVGTERSTPAAIVSGLAR